jgi:hypothetical protein
VGNRQMAGAHPFIGTIRADRGASTLTIELVATARILIPRPDNHRSPRPRRTPMWPRGIMQPHATAVTELAAIRAWKGCRG